MHFGIACLAILAGIFFPAFNSVRKRAEALRLGAMGRNIVMNIIQTNTEREAASLGAAWPSASANFAPWKNSMTDYTAAVVSEEYFIDLVGKKPEDSVTKGLQRRDFSGAGAPAASGAKQFARGGFNAWNVVAGLTKIRRMIRRV